MFRVGDRVVYGSHGVCVIVDSEERSVDRKKLRYLVLEPEGQTGTRFYVPEHNPAALAKMRPLLDKESIDRLLSSDEIRGAEWIEDENRRKQCYRELISGTDYVALLKMVHSIHIYKNQQLESGKKLHLCDVNFLRDAEKLISEEFALVLNMAASEVGAYVQKDMNP